ncbi:MAG: hypothetical protein E7570_03090 [Ruminococcaceae bacterium]|nr:hypothetical protein [Oscillospiraceae bacterium]
MKIKKDSLAIIIAVVLVFAYIFYECYSVMHISFETETALLSTVYEKIDATALVVRDEKTISADSSKITVPCLADGDKINVGGNVAMTFSSNEDAQTYSDYLDIQQELKYYENLESQTVGQAGNVESVNSEIDDDINAFVRSVSSNNVESIEANAAKLNDSVLRRQMIIGENVDLISIIQNLRKQEGALSKTKPKGYIKTDESGIFSSYTDGCEDLVEYGKAQEMSVKDIKNALDKVDELEDNKSAYFGKLVTSYTWYFECVVDSDKVINLENGQRVQVALKDNDGTVLDVQIVSGAEPQAGEKETALIMKSSVMDSGIASMRKEEIEIRTASLEGIKVPTEALHVAKDENGKERKGVYVLISSQVKFREAEVIYSDDDFVLLSFDPDSKNGIRLYDQIITKGKELEDGKVYT